MDIVDQNNWHFTLGALSPNGDTRRTFSFTSAADLACFLSNDAKDAYIAFQSKIDARLKADPVASIWRKGKKPLSELPNFAKYRGNEYDHYHEAARACFNNTQTLEQKKLVVGLEQEINRAGLMIPKGQTVYHGRANLDIITQAPYSTFISTSLSVTVARYHAFKRSLKNGAKPLVFILTLQVPLPAIWGQTGVSNEHELLLPTLLTCVQRRIHEGAFFDVVEADIVKRG